MNEDQYRALCSACDRILLAPYLNVDQIAIPWLHVIRPHPILLDGYEVIFRPQASAMWKRRIRNIASSLSNLAKAFLNGGKPWSSVGQLPSGSCQERCHPLEAFYASFAKVTGRLVCWFANGSFNHTKSGCFQQRIDLLQRFGFAMRASS